MAKLQTEEAALQLVQRAYSQVPHVLAASWYAKHPTITVVCASVYGSLHSTCCRAPEMHFNEGS
jgi:hypothetical protein